MRHSVAGVIQALLLTCANNSSALAQSTVGNGTVFLPSAAQREAYGINDAAPNNNGSAFPTRHYNRGSNNTGIGGSSVGTENVTSESSPAATSISVQRTSALQFRLPKLQQPFDVNFESPALGSFSPALPSVQKSSALTSPFSDSTFSNSNQNSLDTLPSFSKQPSINKMMRFDSFSKF